MNNCSEVSQMALEASEHPLPLRKRIEMHIHLYYCRCCSNFVKQSKLMDKSFEHFFTNMDKAPPFTAPNDFKERLKKQLEEQ